MTTKTDNESAAKVAATAAPVPVYGTEIGKPSAAFRAAEAAGVEAAEDIIARLGAILDDLRELPHDPQGFVRDALLEASNELPRLSGLARSWETVAALSGALLGPEVVPPTAQGETLETAGAMLESVMEAARVIALDNLNHQPGADAARWSGPGDGQGFFLLLALAVAVQRRNYPAEGGGGAPVAVPTVEGGTPNA